MAARGHRAARYLANILRRGGGDADTASRRELKEPVPEEQSGLEDQIAQWRTYLVRQRAVLADDVAELEDHLRDQVASLTGAGLTADEAFLVAVKRLGDLDTISREFAQEYSERLWKQLVMTADSDGKRGAAARTEAVVVVALAVVAAIAIKVPQLFGVGFDDEQAGFYARNVSLFVLPLLAIYFVWKRKVGWVTHGWLVGPFLAAAVFINAYPFTPGGHTEVLAALHLPIALGLAVGIAYAGGHWNTVAGRMNFVRFSGELFIYYSLIAFGGVVLVAFTLAMFASIGVNVEWLVQMWVLPCGALGAVIIGAWLVEAKQNVIENMAPVLTRLFTPLFTIVLLAFLATMLWTGNGINVEREVLIGFDLLLALVLGLLLYAVSARDPQAPPDAFDVLQLILVVSALVVDMVALAAIAGRISEWGFSANKVAALGENLILLVNLSWSAWLYARFLRNRGRFTELERWQTAYLPVYSVWAGLVVVVFPPLFRYV